MLGSTVMMAGLATLFPAISQLMADVGPDGRVKNPLVTAVQPSLWDRNEVWVVAEKPLAKETAGNAENFLLHPSGSILAAEPHPSAPNVVRLVLCPEEPLQPDRVYTVRLISGHDAEGNPLDTYWTHVDFTARSITGELDHILGTQLPDGAIAINRSRELGWVRGIPVRVVPYFSCMSGVGLLKGYSITGHERLLDAVRDYVDWHVAHFQEDNTITDFRGSYPDYPSTQDYDSTDSYGALFVYLLWQYYMHTGDRDFLEANHGNMMRAISAMELTLEDDHLTWAKPAWRIKYTMDNVEVFQGYQAAAQISRVLGRGDDFAEFAQKADRTRQAVLEGLYKEDGNPPRFAVGMDGRGDIFGGWRVYYPDGMANDFVLAYLLPPEDSRAAAAWEEGRARFLADHVPDDDVEFFMAKAALRHGDHLSYILANAASSALHAEADWSFNSGQLIRLAHRLRGYAAYVPETDSITAGGPEWSRAMRLSLHPVGEGLEVDNPQALDFDAPDGYHTASLLRDEDGIVLSVTSYADPRLSASSGRPRILWEGALVDEETGGTEDFRLAPDSSPHGDGIHVYTAMHRFDPAMMGSNLRLELSVTETGVTDTGEDREVTLSLERGNGRLLLDRDYPESMLPHLMAE